MMSIGLAKLYSGDCNVINIIGQSDGTKIVTITKRGEDKQFRIHVKNLGQENETVLKHEVIPTTSTKMNWLKIRLEEAKKWKEDKEKERKSG